MVFVRFDAFVLRKAEQFAHRFQRMTGRTNFWLARMAHGFSALYCLLWLLGMAVDNSLFQHSVMAAIAAVLLLSDTALHKGYKQMCLMLDEYYAAGNGTAHQLTLMYRERALSRMLTWYLTVWFAFVMWVLIPGAKGSITLPERCMPLAVASYLAAQYFIACIPLPPCKGTVKEWLRGLVATPAKPVEATETA